MKNARIKGSIFTRVIVVFLLVVIPVYMLGMIIFVMSRDMMIKQYHDGIQKQVSIYFSSLQDDLEHIKQMQENFLFDEDLNNLKYYPVEEMDYDMSRSINRVMDRLDDMMLSSKTTQTVSVDILKLQRRLSSSPNKITYGDVTSDMVDIFLNSSKWNGYVGYADDDYYIASTPTYWAKDVSNLSFVVHTKLSKKEIINKINQCNMVDGAMSFIKFNIFDSYLSLNYSEEITEYVKNIDTDEFETKHAITQSIDGKSYLVSRYYFKYLDAWYTQLIPEDIALQNINQFKVWYNIFGGVMIITSILYTISTYMMVKKPMDILVSSFKRVEKEDFDVNIKHRQNDEFAVVYTSFNKMVTTIKKLINEVYMGKILNQKSELRQLQAQINPHFLYNSFFILKNRIARKQYDNAVEFCEMLGLYFNYINKNFKDYSTLEEEVKHARIYADIQAIRFFNRIDIEFDRLPSEFNNVVVPKLILQPLIENAFKYGLEQTEFDGMLKVSFEKSKDGRYLDIIVEDNGQELASDSDALAKLQSIFTDEDMIKEPTGLLNIHRRIQLFSNKLCGITFNKSEMGGLRVTVTVTIKMNGSDN